MTLSTVAVDDPVLASREQQVIAHVNASPGRQIFTSNGTFSVPNGVHKFRVYLAAGGSGGDDHTITVTESSTTVVAGLSGNSAHLSSAEYVGVAIGTSFAVTIGAGGAAAPNLGTGGWGGSGGTTSFGTYSATGATHSSKGTVTFPASPNSMYHANGLYMNSSGLAYGQGGSGGDGLNVATAGRQGIVVVEW